MTKEKKPDGRKNNPGRIENLKNFQKGQSGNPKGRTPDLVLRPITTRIKKHMEMKLPEDVQQAMKLQPGATYADALVHQAFIKAVKGDSSALRELTDRVEGTVTQRTEISTPEDRTVNIRVVYDEEKK